MRAFSPLRAIGKGGSSTSGGRPRKGSFDTLIDLDTLYGNEGDKKSSDSSILIGSTMVPHVRQQAPIFETEQYKKVMSELQMAYKRKFGSKKTFF